MGSRERPRNKPNVSIARVGGGGFKPRAVECTVPFARIQLTRGSPIATRRTWLPGPPPIRSLISHPGLCDGRTTEANHCCHGIAHMRRDLKIVLLPSRWAALRCGDVGEGMRDPPEESEVFYDLRMEWGKFVISTELDLTPDCISPSLHPPTWYLHVLGPC
ncbi:uncharacterized protein N7459_003776 [Penicillium hispanicum]|uniref:uncharacterized protein n=1 Tax=Penicillium hispanicum TaxID=1080232 RepID=UPI002540DD62|nr:uncharacterized protein N7459_003776 [Penicillium hispanicum]KAJ5588011.1 hypothetical protein N7459_003776 [Penicillium hispanicum]